MPKAISETEDQDPKGHVISVRLPRPLLDQVEAAAAREMIGVSQWVRRCALNELHAMERAAEQIESA
jgi:hypothetical protein